MKKKYKDGDKFVVSVKYMTQLNNHLYTIENIGVVGQPTLDQLEPLQTVLDGAREEVWQLLQDLKNMSEQDREKYFGQPDFGGILDGYSLPEVKKRFEKWQEDTIIRKNDLVLLNGCVAYVLRCEKESYGLQYYLILNSGTIATLSADQRDLLRRIGPASEKDQVEFLAKAQQHLINEMTK